MVIECCCLRPKVEDELSPDKIEKTEKKPVENQFDNISNMSNDVVKIDKSKISTEANVDEPQIDVKIELKKNINDIKSKSVNNVIKEVEKDLWIIEGKSMYINGSNNGVLSDCSLSDSWNIEFVKFDINSIRFSNTVVIDNLANRFNAMRLVCRKEGAYVRIDDNKINRSYVDFFYDSSLQIKTDVSGDVFIKTDDDKDSSLVYIFNFNNKIIVKGLSLNYKLNMFKLNDNNLSFDNIIQQESFSELFVSNLNELIDVFSEKFNIIIVNCSC